MNNKLFLVIIIINIFFIGGGIISNIIYITSINNEKINKYKTDHKYNCTDVNKKDLMKTYNMCLINNERPEYCVSQSHKLLCKKDDKNPTTIYKQNPELGIPLRRFKNKYI